MKKVLITGITGFAGSHLMDYILENTDYEVYGIKRMNSNLRNVNHALDRITLYDADLLDESSLISVLRKVQPDQIYHLGALSWVTPSWDMPAVYMQTNAIGTINLFEAMRVTDCNARVLTSATPEEFGDVPEDMIPITEETRIKPINPYAASKAAQDMVCITYHASYNIAMQILVTGGSGFIGRNLIRALAVDKNTTVFSLSSKYTEISGASTIQCDILNRAAVKVVFQKFHFDAVIHLAAITEHHAIVDDRFKTFQTNFQGTINLLEMSESSERDQAEERPHLHLRKRWQRCYCVPLSKRL